MCIDGQHKPHQTVIAPLLIQHIFAHFLYLQINEELRRAQEALRTVELQASELKAALATERLEKEAVVKGAKADAEKMSSDVQAKIAETSQVSASLKEMQYCCLHVTFKLQMCFNLRSTEHANGMIHTGYQHHYSLHWSYEWAETAADQSCYQCVRCVCWNRNCVRSWRSSMQP